MRRVCSLGLLWLLASGCLEHQISEISAGQPDVLIGSDTWFQGERNAVLLSWPNAELCDDEDWFCVNNPAATVTVLSASCNNCTFTKDPTGVTMLTTDLIGIPADAVATADGEISIVALLRFDATGAMQLVTGNARSDHEIALAARCMLVDSAIVDAIPSSQALELTVGQTRDCATATTRLLTDSVIVLPSLTTLASGPRFPFCTVDCTSQAP